ncbi:DUF4906 domain-containing protein [Bacteroides sp.]
MRKIQILCLLFLLVHFTACEERSRFVEDNAPEGESVAVSLAVDIADEEDGTLLQPQTRAGYAVPDALYELHILQFDRDGNPLDANGSEAGNVFYVAKADLGGYLTLSLTKSDDCQLVIIARGEGNTTPSISGNLADVRKLSMAQSLFNDIPVSGATQAQINKMPYVLHLPHVKVDESGAVQSTVNGTEDVRIRLKRLAVKLTATWVYSVKDYNLKQILLQSVPLNFSFIPAPDETDGTYPSLLEQFTTISIPAVTNSGTYSLWIPANVRGESASATSLKLRTRNTAPTGSCFLNFVAVDATDSKKKLDYRVYLGDDKPTDFNLKSNRDYNYVIDFNHFGIPTDDQRVTYIDPVPASEGNDNLVPTANCFMVAPGGSFCFDPFMFRQNGVDIENTTLTGWSTQIRSVKLLWQTKENGDVGDPVIGIVNTADDHTNIVDIKNTDGTSAPYIKGKARIYCRVAANTTGGSGVIAAYDGDNGTGNILWSWHIWVTDYNPSPLGDVTVLEKNKRKLKYVYAGLPNQLPMMDRNLGAFDSYNEIPESILKMSRANGYHYQRGRKDPFPSSYTMENLPAVYKFTLSKTEPPKHVLNRYDASGFLAIVPQKLSYPSLQTAYRNPISIASAYKLQWCSGTRPAWSKTKTVHDPCPAGWRIPESSELQALVNNNTTSVIPDLWTGAGDKGGLLLKYDNTGNRTYMRFTGYPPTIEQLNNVGVSAYTTTTNDQTVFSVNLSNTSIVIRQMDNYDAHTTRCIQERAD